MRPLLQERHFNGGLRCLVALLIRANLRLLIGVGREHSIANRNVELKPNACDAGGRFVSDDFEVIGVALDHTAQCD